MMNLALSESSLATIPQMNKAKEAGSNKSHLKVLYHLVQDAHDLSCTGYHMASQLVQKLE
jgi:hypothetical protein